MPKHNGTNGKAGHTPLLQQLLIERLAPAGFSQIGIRRITTLGGTRISVECADGRHYNGTLTFSFESQTFTMSFGKVDLTLPLDLIT